MNEPRLFPRPQRYVEEPGYLECPLSLDAGQLPEGLAEAMGTLWPQVLAPKGNIELCPADGMGEEEYALAVRPDGAEIRFSHRAGALYALMTLRQLALSGSPIPCCRMEDHPGLRDRAALVDVSRGKIPTLDTLKRLIDLMAQFKLNQLQLYIEGFSFEYPSFCGQGPERPDALTPEDIRTLDRYCAQRCIQLVPNQNCLGHMYLWLQLPEYSHLAECPGGVSIKGITIPPTTLDPANPAALALVERMMDDLLPCFSSPLFNVDLDEPFELGMGNNKARAEQEGVDGVYLDYAHRLNRAVKERGRRMMLWGDVLAKSERALDRLDRDVIVLDWGYEAEHPVRRRAQRLHEAGLEFYLCPGTNSWASFTGITDNMLECVGNAVEAAYDFGARGLMVTDWGDFGHLQYPVFSMPGMVYAACGAWNRTLPDREGLAWVLDRFIFLDRAGVLGEVCLRAGEYAREEEFQFPCRTNAFMTLQAGWTDKAGLEAFFQRTVASLRFFVEPCVYQPYEQRYAGRRDMDEQRILTFIDTLLRQLQQARPQGDGGRLICEELANGLHMARAATRLRAHILGLDDGAGLEEEMEALCAVHQRLWLARNRASGLSASLEGFRAVLRGLEQRERGAGCERFSLASIVSDGAI